MHAPLRTVVALSACLSPLLAGASEPGTHAMLTALLRQAGWSADWIGPGGSGRTEVVFEKRAERIVAKIKLLSPIELECENPVVVEGSSITFDGCRDPGVTLVYDPHDLAYPLHGRSPRGYVWNVKPK